MSANDTNAVRGIVDQAEHSEDVLDFNNRVRFAQFSSNLERNKLEVFKHHLKIANNNSELTDDQLPSLPILMRQISVP